MKERERAGKKMSISTRKSDKSEMEGVQFRWQPIKNQMGLVCQSITNTFDESTKLIFFGVVFCTLRNYNGVERR